MQHLRETQAFLESTANIIYADISSDTIDINCFSSLHAAAAAGMIAIINLSSSRVEVLFATMGSHFYFTVLKTRGLYSLQVFVCAFMKVPCEVLQ